MYSQCVALQIHQQKTDEKQWKLVKIYFHFSALIAYAMSLQRALYPIQTAGEGGGVDARNNFEDV